MLSRTMHPGADFARKGAERLCPLCGSLPGATKHQGPTSLDFLQVLAPIVFAIAYLHSHTIMHRDLKPGACTLLGRNTMIGTWSER